MEKSVKIVNETGVHARPAAALVELATKFTSEINIETSGKKVNAKSIMNILGLGLQKDTEVTFSANGEDATEAVEALTALVASGFSEA